MNRPRGDRGSALLVASILALMLSAMAAAYLSIAYVRHKTVAGTMQGEKAFMIAEAGLSQALYEMNTNSALSNLGTNLLNGATLALPTGATDMTTGSFLGGDFSAARFSTGFDGAALPNTAPNVQYRMRCVGKLYTQRDGVWLTDAVRIVEVIVQAPVPAQDVEGLGAVVANGPLEVSGNMVIDGNDHEMDGTANGDAGVPGILCSGEIEGQGSALVGGAGNAPSGFTKDKVTGENNFSSTVAEETYDWSSGTDDDSDGTIDEEAWDGIDNDGDGLIDEDTNDFPQHPDAMLKLPEGTLETYATSHGTYFATYADWVAYTNSLPTTDGTPGNFILPGGQIFYLEFDPGADTSSFDIGHQLNADPSIFVVHNASNNATIKNVHGEFMGLFIADVVDHVNAGTLIVGSVMCRGSLSNAFGNGNSSIVFSQDALSNLPSAAVPSSNFQVLAWRRVGAGLSTSDTWTNELE